MPATSSIAARLLRPALVLAPALGAAACKGDTPGAPARPASLEITAAPTTSAAGVAISPAPTFVVKDEGGAVIGGVPVTISVAGGGGTIASAPARTAGGAPTSVGVWTLGRSVGENVLSVAVAGLDPQRITVGGIAGPPATVAIVSGGDQSAFGGRTLGAPVVFQVRDQFANGVPSVPVTYTVTGGGTVATTGGVSGGDGTLTGPSWTLGKVALPQGLIARAGPVGGTALAAVRTSFDIDVRFTSPTMTEAQRLLFTNAAARLRAMITGDIPDVDATGFNPSGPCGVSGQATLAEVIDDVLIYAAIMPIDGPGGTLAQAGPCAFRTTDVGRLPAIGVMQFDVADVERLAGQGGLQDVIMHEMMHVLGFSAGYFQLFGFLANFNLPTVNFFGPRGLAGCRGVGGTVTCASSVPLENTGGQGTANSHWRESVFVNELMTGYANSGSMPISAMTVGAFEDIGYQVNYDARDGYLIPGGSLRASGAGGRAPAQITAEGWERGLPTPGVVIVGRGRFEPVEPAPVGPRRSP